MRAVLDTNVLVSAVIGRDSPPDKIVRAWQLGGFELVTSPPLLDELAEVLQRPSIARLTGHDATASREWVRAIRASAFVVHPEVTLEVIEDDPSDNRVAEAALAAEADFIVSGDRHLLRHTDIQGIRVVTPARFLAILALDEESPD